VIDNRIGLDRTHFDLPFDLEWQRRVSDPCSVGRFRTSAKIHTIFEGTSEIQQLVIARAISGLRVE